MNANKETRSIGFADDLIIYTKSDEIEKARNKLQSLFHKVLDYFDTWWLLPSIDKCETILFRPNMNKLKKKNINVNKWKICYIVDNTINNNKLIHKDKVKYLGFLIYEKLNYRQHILNRTKKAKKAFYSLKSLFYFKKLNSNVKLLCYILLIRAILIY